MTNSVVGIDVGGTFTDLVLLDEAGNITLGKTPSTPANQAEGIMTGLRSTVPDFAALARIAHGTTVSTNALLQGIGGPVGLITTRGFRDATEIGRTRRMLPSLYDPAFIRPPPLVPRPLRLEITERLAPDGTTLHPLSESDLAAAAHHLAGKVRAIAICFLHSWANPAHERQAAEILRRLLPETLITTSHEVIPEFREYERFSTTVINAFLLPVMDHYLASLDHALAAQNCSGKLTTMSSAGGTLDTPTTRRLPVRTILSGPAGGVAGALWIAQAANLTNFITCDMGGTSTDVCVVENFRPALVSETAFAGYPLKGLQYDINTVGAGGGSIAHAEADLILKVGPRSAGANPGPACYAHGGTEPTVTDANLVLGRLGTQRALGGSVTLDRPRAHAAIATLAARLTLPPEDLAEGILRLAGARMAGAIRAITIERGADPADYTLFPFGGAGAMHGCDLAEELGISSVFVPIAAGNLSALGLLASDQRQEIVRTWLRPLETLTQTDLATLIASQESTGRALPLLVGLPPEKIRFEHSLDMRYARQAFEIAVPLPDSAITPAALRTLFLTLYRQLYGQADPNGAIEIVTIRTMAIGLTDKPTPKKLPPATTPATPHTRRQVRHNATTSFWNVYDRATLAPTHHFPGPAIIEEANATTIVLPSWLALVDDWGNIILKREEPPA